MSSLGTFDAIDAFSTYNRVGKEALVVDPKDLVSSKALAGDRCWALKTALERFDDELFFCRALGAGGENYVDRHLGSAAFFEKWDECVFLNRGLDDELGKPCDAGSFDGELGNRVAVVAMEPTRDADAFFGSVGSIEDPGVELTLMGVEDALVVAEIVGLLRKTVSFEVVGRGHDEAPRHPYLLRDEGRVR